MKRIFILLFFLLTLKSFSQVYIDPGVGLMLKQSDGNTPYRINVGVHNLIGDRVGFYATGEFGNSGGRPTNYFRDIEGGIIRLSKVVSLYGGVGFFSKGIIENGLKVDGVRKEIGLDFLIKKLHLNLDIGYSISRGATANVGYVIAFKKRSEKLNRGKVYDIPLAEKVKQPAPPVPSVPAIENDSVKNVIAKTDSVKSSETAVPVLPVISSSSSPTDNQNAALLKGEDVKFSFGKALIDPSYISKLNELIAFLKINEQFNLIIYGHTCDIGTTEVNDAVSRQRAEAAKRYLVAGGIDPSRITAKGMGERSPLVPNIDPASRMKNRRIEFEKVEIKK